MENSPVSTVPYEGEKNGTTPGSPIDGDEESRDRSAIDAGSPRGKNRIASDRKRVRSPSPSNYTDGEDGEVISASDEDGSIFQLKVRQKKTKIVDEDEKDFDLFSTSARKDASKWRLPSKLADYYNENARRYISEKEIDETIREDYPVPSNINKAPLLDSFMSSMLKSGGHNYVLDKDKDWQKVQSKIRDVMGPLASAWSEVELFRRGDSEEPIDIHRTTDL